LEEPILWKIEAKYSLFFVVITINLPLEAGFYLPDFGSNKIVASKFAQLWNNSKLF
jgi:hypothetical protein